MLTRARPGSRRPTSRSEIEDEQFPRENARRAHSARYIEPAAHDRGATGRARGGQLPKLAPETTPEHEGPPLRAVAADDVEAALGCRRHRVVHLRRQVGQ